MFGTDRLDFTIERRGAAQVNANHPHISINLHKGLPATGIVEDARAAFIPADGQDLLDPRETAETRD
jgi:hypothetical protein